MQKTIDSCQLLVRCPLITPHKSWDRDRLCDSGVGATAIAAVWVLGELDLTGGIGVPVPLTLTFQSAVASADAEESLACKEQ